MAVAEALMGTLGGGGGSTSAADSGGCAGCDVQFRLTLAVSPAECRRSDRRDLASRRSCLRTRESVAGDRSESTWEKLMSRDQEIKRDTKG
uniref:Uncharacterized protein n=1 Tax=Oryza sativa subsp. japonica TaxID=39947 RepID=Q6Z262_ORYSJ|nr:hypothetical protein [Oryza sativa Japonica Group]BAD03532.1 hypothetical protein [Oryza sativa Japonica Group]